MTRNAASHPLLADFAVADLAVECLARSGTLRLRVTGSSMLPAIRSGSHVEIRRAGPSEVVPGDIVLVRVTGGFRLHRLVAREGLRIITRGDNHTENDPPEPVAQLLGVVSHVHKPRLLPRVSSRLLRKFRAI